MSELGMNGVRGVSVTVCGDLGVRVYVRGWLNIGVDTPLLDI